MPEQAAHIGPFDELAGIHHDHLVGILGDHAEVVGDQEDRHAELVAQAHQELQDLRLDGDVQRRGGLVGDQELGVAGERHRDHDPLAQAARELVRILREAPLRRADPDHAQQLEHPRADRGAAHVAMQAQRLADLEADRKGRVEAGHRLLKDHADAVAAHVAHGALVQRQQVLAVERDAACPRSAPAGRAGAA